MVSQTRQQLSLQALLWETQISLKTSECQKYIDNKVHEIIAAKLLNTTVFAFKVLPLESYEPMSAPSPPSKQFYNWFCVTAFRATVVLLLMSSVSSKCLPFNISFTSGNKKKSLGLYPVNKQGVPTVICLVAKNSFTDSAMWAGELPWCKIHELLAKSSVRFHLTFPCSLSSTSK